MWTGCISIRLRQILLGSDVPAHAKRCSGTHQQGSHGGTKMHVVLMCAKWPQHPASGGLWAQSWESQWLQLAAATCIWSLRALFHKVSESGVLTAGCRRTQQLVLIGSKRQQAPTNRFRCQHCASILPRIKWHQCVVSLSNLVLIQPVQMP